MLYEERSIQRLDTQLDNLVKHILHTLIYTGIIFKLVQATLNFIHAFEGSVQCLVYFSVNWCFSQAAGLVYMMGSVIRLYSVTRRDDIKVMPSGVHTIYNVIIAPRAHIVLKRTRGQDTSHCTVHSQEVSCTNHQMELGDLRFL